MTVLIVTGFDSTNAVLARCAVVLRERGHEVLIVSADPSDGINNGVFAFWGLEVHPIASATDELLGRIDAVVGSPIKPHAYDALYQRVYERGILLFSFATLFSSVTMRILPDFVFVTGEQILQEFVRNGFDYRFIKIGNPQYDDLVLGRRQRLRGELKKVLVVEQGGYPYGRKGKQQLADSLMRIARDNPGIVFDIKPRYQPGQRRGALHAVSEHLADFLGDAPDNLRLLDDRRTLEDVVVDYDAMITMWSTAYLAAVASGMPLLLLHGFDSVDVYDVRQQRVDEAYAHLESTGCLLHYSELRGDVTRLFKVVGASYSEKALFNFHEPCADGVVSFMEVACETLGEQNLRIKVPFCLTPDEYYARFGEFELVDAGSPSYKAFSAYRRIVNDELQEYVFQNRCMAQVLDMAPLLRHRDKMNAGGGEGAIKQMKDAMKRDFLDVRTAFFESEEGFALARNDRITQDYYFDWLYEVGNAGAIENDEVVPLLVPETREYYLARLALDDCDFGKAHEHLYDFLHIASSREVVQLMKVARMKKFLQPFRDKGFLFACAIRLATPRGRSLLKLAFSYKGGSIFNAVKHFLV